MGQSNSKSKKYDAVVHIESRDLTGVTAQVVFHMTLFDANGNKCGPYKQENVPINGVNVVKFALPKFSHKVPIGVLKTVEFWHDYGHSQPPSEEADWLTWNIDVIWVQDLRTNNWSAFPLCQMTRSGEHFTIPLLNTFLPDNDPNPDERRHEINRKRALYEYDQVGKYVPVQVLRLPPEETYSSAIGDKFSLKERITTMVEQTHLKFIAESTAPWDHLSDLKTLIFRSELMGSPQGLEKFFADQRIHDEWFGYQRIGGPNPGLLRICQTMPEKLNIDASVLNQFTEHWSVERVLEAKRLFYIDFQLFDDVTLKSGAQLVAPIALFFRTGEHKIVPIAIQLYQKPSSENPVFLPSDPPFVWHAAKMWFNYADAIYQQAINHIGLSHLLVEGMCLCTHRNLAGTHPISRLLMPHFRDVLYYNIKGLEQLVSENGWFDELTDLGRENLFWLIGRWASTFQLDKDANLPQDLADRGLYSSRILRDYPFRDDGLPIWNAIQDYVRMVVKTYYDSKDDLEQDYELQQWRYELSRTKKNGGVEIQGISNSGTFQTTDELVSCLTSIIFICTAYHSTSLMHFDHFGFLPNYPLHLKGRPPSSKNPSNLRSMEHLLQYIPDKRSTCQQAVLSRLSKEAPSTSLLNKATFLHDNQCIGASRRLYMALEKIEVDIGLRNQNRIAPFTSLLPSNIPSSVDC